MSRALILIDHGSRREEARRHLEELAERIRERAPELLVRIAHMELAEPTLEQAVGDCASSGARTILVHPFFLVPGRHLTEDIPALVRAAAARFPETDIRVTTATGSLPGLEELILSAL